MHEHIRSLALDAVSSSYLAAQEAPIIRVRSHFSCRVRSLIASSTKQPGTDYQAAREGARTSQHYHAPLFSSPYIFELARRLS